MAIITQNKTLLQEIQTGLRLCNKENLPKLDGV